MDGTLVLKNITKEYENDDRELVFEKFNLTVKKGEFISIFGPNGVGKTTLLNLIAGLTEKQKGDIKILGFKGKKPKVGFVFQNYRESLFPWLTARENIAFPLRVNGFDNKEISKSIGWVTKLVKANFNFKKYPYQLSGGQQQLVSLMRNIVLKPDIFLLDEPFSSMDFQAMLSLLKTLMNIWLNTKVTTLFVSHDIDSALFLSQRLIFLKGRPAKIVKILKNNSSYPRSINYVNSKKVTNLKKKIISLYERG